MKAIMAEADLGRKHDIMATSVVVLLLTLIGAGVGFAVGAILGEGDSAEIVEAEPAREKVAVLDSPTPSSELDEDPITADEEAPGTSSSDDVSLTRFPPVLTTLADPKGKWIRLEGSIMVRKESEKSPELLAEEAGDQILTYLRSVRLSQLESPSGILGLRDDLDETVQILSGGDVRGVLIHGLVVE
jgi:flagellar basal body-associated protein FliL